MIEHIYNSFRLLFSSIESWVVSAILFVISFLGNGSTYILFITVAVLIDLVVGVVRSYRIQNIKLKSSGIFNAICKLLIYMSLIILFVLLDKIFGMDETYVFTRGISAIILTGEIWSIIANLAILHPDIKVFKLIKKFVESEIAEKTGIDKNEIQKELDENNNNSDSESTTTNTTENTEAK